MSPRSNELGQPIGPPQPGWEGAAAIPREKLEGHWCCLEPLDLETHAAELFAAYSEAADASLWTYLAYGPFETLDAYREWLRLHACGDDPLFVAIRERESGRAIGVASWLRIEPAMGSVEVGHLCYAPALQRTRAATEAMALMMARAFELGYRRYEWKCDALNAPSRRAARRLGFRFEGVFRQHMVYNGRNRDTAWFSVLDGEWPLLRERFERWLDPSNFGADGRQLQSLGVPARSPHSAADVTLRAATAADLVDVVALLADDALGRTREDPGPPLPASYARALEAIEADPRNELIVAEVAGAVRGVLQLTVVPGLTYQGRERAIVEGVRIARGHRGSGLGRRLVSAAIERARARGCHQVQVSTDRMRDDALRFYEGLGFRVSHSGLRLSL